MWQYHPVLLLFQLGVLVSLGVAAYCGWRLWRRRWSVVVACVGLFALFNALFNAASTMKVASPGLEAKLLFYKLEFLGAATNPSVALALALAYLGLSRWLSRGVLLGLSLIPALWILLVWANPGGLMITEPRLVTHGGIRALEHSFPPLFLTYLAWVLGTVLLAGLLLVGQALSGRRDPRPGILLGLALILPVGSTFLKMFGVYPPGGEGINVTPTFTTASLVLVGLAIGRYHLFELLPVGRRQALEAIGDGYLLVDATGEIIDDNPAARKILGAQTGETAPDESTSDGTAPDGTAQDGAPTGGTATNGTATGEASPREASPREASSTETMVGRQIEEVLPAGKVPTGEEETVSFTRANRAVQAHSSPITDGERLIGKALIFRDVTALRSREEELRRENERLDRFASVLSHDLRNPLNVAQGRLQLAKEKAPEDPEGHLSSVGRALGRMDEIIEDMLLLTWSEREIDPADLKPTELENAAREAWDSIEAPDATLEVAASAKLQCHEGRLRRLLENLFRNAVEHGGASVAITIGTFAGEGPQGGFYVEDDGPGIPEEKREKVLEGGYSSRKEGTGLGLSIVKGIAEAHGWSISVAESRTGGARFGFHGVELRGE